MKQLKKIQMTVAVAVLLFASCTGNKVKQQKNNDSIALATATDSATKTQADSIEAAKIETSSQSTNGDSSTQQESIGDLRTFGLYGSVKALVEKENRYGFDKNGRLSSFNGKPLAKTFKKVVRDNQGRITFLRTDDIEDFGYRYNYNSQGNVKSYSEDLYFTGNPEYTYEYDTAGNMIKSTCQSQDETGERLIVCLYSGYVKDVHSNWIKRDVKKHVVEIEYCEDNNEKKTTKTSQSVEKRTITYY